MLKISRRQLLAVTTLTLAIKFHQKLFKPFLSSVHEESNALLSNYIQFNLYGAPSRSLFDLLLRPHGNEKFNDHPFLATEIGSDNPHLTYKTFLHNKLHIPSFWQNNLSDSLGNSTRASDLLNNMLTIRGCDMKQNGHQINNKILAAPRTGEVSLTALIAAKGKGAIPYVGYRSRTGGREIAPDAFKSLDGIAAMNLPYGVENPIDYVFGKELNDKEIRNEIVDGMLEELYKLEEKENPFASKFSVENKKSQEISAKMIAVLKSDFKAAHEKYDMLICRNLKNTLKGIDDKKIDFISEFKKKSWDLVDFDGDIIINEDLRESLVDAEAEEMAIQFAFIEVMLKNNISSSMVIVLNPLGGVRLQLASPISGPLGINPGKQQRVKSHIMPDFDSHRIGAIPNILYLSKFYQVFSASLLELRNTLMKMKDTEGNSLFDKTLFHIASEFDREPDKSVGSAHGFNGSTHSFISGRIKSHDILGDILTSSSQLNTICRSFSTWGHGAQIKELGEREISYGNIISSLSLLYDIPSLTPNNPSLFSIKNGKIQFILNNKSNIENG
jgi:hypothetical protein